MEIITSLWNNLFFQPMLNLLIFVASVLGGNFGIAVILFTLVIRMLTLPFTIQQMNASKAQQRLQPLLAEAKKKYGATSREYQQETQRIYSENGVNPFGGCLLSFVQFPIWIGLYNAVIQALGDQPDQLLNLTPYLYNIPRILQSVPFDNHFLWLNLTHPDPIYILPIAVAVTGWLSTRLMPLPTDPQQAQTAQAMQFMPLMFAFFTLTVPSGLALYWVTSNIFQVVSTYFIYKKNPPIVPPAASDAASKAGGKSQAVAKTAPRSTKEVAKETSANGKQEPVKQTDGEVKETRASLPGTNGTTNTNSRKPRRAIKPRRRSS